MSTISRALEKQRREQAQAAGALPYEPSSPEQAVLRPSQTDHPPIRPAPRPPARRAAPAPRASAGLKVPAWTLALALLCVAVGVGYFAGSGESEGSRAQANQAAPPAAAVPAVAEAPATPAHTPVVVRVEVAVKQETPDQAPAAPPVEHVLQDLPIPPAPIRYEPLPQMDIPVEPAWQPSMGIVPPMDDPPAEEPAPRRSKSRREEPPPLGNEGYKLEGIFWSEKDPMALINGEIVSVGKVVNGARIKSIEKSAVIIEINGREVRLTN